MKTVATQGGGAGAIVLVGSVDSGDPIGSFAGLGPPLGPSLVRY